MDKTEEDQHDPILPIPLIIKPPPPPIAERPMTDYAQPSTTGTQSRIARPVVHANIFEIKPNVI